jgi:hypothetical protein
MSSKLGAHKTRSAAGAVVALALSTLPSASATAAKPPYEGCVAVAKQEYNAAKKQHLLRTRFTQYVRTGLPGRRQYWYCR